MAYQFVFCSVLRILLCDPLANLVFDKWYHSILQLDIHHKVLSDDEETRSCHTRELKISEP